MNWVEAQAAVDNWQRVGIVGDPGYVEYMLPLYEVHSTKEVLRTTTNYEPCKYNPVTGDFIRYYTPEPWEEQAEWELRT